METLWWFLAEALAAAVLLALIVWWTWPRARKGVDKDVNNAPGKEPPK